MKELKLILIILFGWLQYSLLVGKNGIYDCIQIGNDIVLTCKYINMSKIINHNLEVKINNFSKGFEELEEYARNKLGMMKEGETFYRLELN